MKKINIVFSIFLCIFTLSCESVIKEKLTKMSYRGVVTEIYRDPENHYAYTFSIRTSQNEFSTHADFYPKSWEWAEIGDSIIKEQGQLSVTIKKKDGECGVFYYQY